MSRLIPTSHVAVFKTQIYALETTNLARTQIIAQASTAMLAQANNMKQTVLALLD